MSPTAVRDDMTSHPLAKAAREVNAYSEKHGIQATCEYCNLKVDDVRYIAEQRALRALYAFKGINLNLTEPAMLMLSPAEEHMVTKLTAAYMDGLIIGVKAREFMAEDKNETL